MPFAITLCLDPASAGVVEAMWRTLHERGIDSDRHRLGYPPHISLAICPDDARRDRLDAALALASDWSALPVTLSGLGIFAAATSILWVAPVVTAELLARHAAILGALEGEEIDPYYHAGVWVPHITLAESLADPAAAVAAVLPMCRPVPGLLDRIDLIRFRPVETLRCYQLKTHR